MSYRKIIDKECNDLSMLADMLFKLSNSYKMLSGGASDLNGIALARKKDVRDAVKRVAALGEVIDDLIETIDYIDCAFFDYSKLKAEYISCKTNIELIKAEVDEKLNPLSLTEKKP